MNKFIYELIWQLTARLISKKWNKEEYGPIFYHQKLKVDETTNAEKKEFRAFESELGKGAGVKVFFPVLETNSNV